MERTVNNYVDLFGNYRVVSLDTHKGTLENSIKNLRILQVALFSQPILFIPYLRISEIREKYLEV